jgi:release factor glutamine methyltransferase
MAEQTVSEAIREAAGRLSETSDTARLDAELLMAEALGVTRSELLLRHTRDIVPQVFADLIARRMRHEPIAYILGHQDFYGRSFIVTPEVLIPRGDSECVVQAALDVMPETGPLQGRVLDCGTGSGALLLTLLAERPGIEGVGIDNSLGALAVAAANAARLGVQDRARLLRLDWHDANWHSGIGQFDLIIANPPYVETTAQLALSVREYEPDAALFAGPDGLDDYRILIPQLCGLLRPNGVGVLEIGATQAEAVSDLARPAGFTVTMRRDLAERPRALVLQ